MKMKQLMSTILCICLSVGLTACGGNGNLAGKIADNSAGETVGDNSSVQEGSASAEEVSEEEPVELTYCGADSVVGMEDTEIIDYIEKKLNIKLTFVQYTPDQWAAGMASGDLPDIFQTRAKRDAIAVTIEEAIDAGVILELTDLVEEYGPNIKQNIPNVLDYMRTYRSNGTGGLYGINTNVPTNNREGEDTVSDYGVGFCVRWDYYKEMGYPEITNEDELLDMLKQMQEAHPVTEDGKPVYSFGGFSDWGLWSYFVPYAFQHGWMNGEGCLFGPNCEVQPMFGEGADIFKKAMKFMNKANRMGLCDPEMFTMKNADFVGKHANLQYLSVPCTWYNSDAIATQREQGVAETDLGWRMIPGAFPEMYGGYPSIFGSSDRPTVISKNCKNPEAAMRFLDYMSSFEGSRILMSGVEGVHWEIIDGKKEFTEEIMQRRLDDFAEFRKETGIGLFWNMQGLANNARDEEGQYLDLGKTDKAVVAGLSEADKDFSEHYGVEYPAQAYQARGNITYFNLEPSNMAKALDNDMQMIETQCENYYMTLVAKLINSSSDEEFEKNWEAGCAELDAMGYNKMMEAYTANVEEAREELERLGN